MARWRQPQSSDFVGGSRLRLIVGIVALLSATLGLAAIFPAEPAATAPADTHSTLTPAEAERALDVLQDAAKRDELIETLRAIVKASPPLLTQPTATSVEAPIAADGFGADALLYASTQIGEFSAQIEQSVRAATKLPLFWRWLANTVTDPQAQQLLLSVVWRAVAAGLLAFLAERVAQFALRGPPSRVGNPRGAGSPSDGSPRGSRRRRGFRPCEWVA